MKRKSNWFDIAFLSLGWLTIIIAYIYMPDSPWSLISGLLGICSVFLCSKGNILTFFFGIGQITTYSYLCYLQSFYAGIGMSCFYLVTQIVGLFTWRKRMKAHNEKATVDTTLPTRRLSWKMMIIMSLVVILLAYAVGWFLDNYTNDTQPYFDAFTTVPAIGAQLLMILAYREQWYLWLIIDVLYVIMWGRAENYCMLMQYIFWCGNCVYGMVQWKKNLVKN